MVPDFIESIVSFIDKVDFSLKKNKIIESRSISFNRFVTFNKEKIPLGKIIIDDTHEKIFIYETFCSSETLICSPDINIIRFSNLLSCEYEISKYEFNIIIKTKGKRSIPIILSFHSVLDKKTITIIHSSLNAIIKSKRKK